MVGTLTFRRLAGAGRSAIRYSSTFLPAGQVHVLSACNEYRQETIVLERSAVRAGYNFRAVGLNKPWRGLGSKLLRYDEALQENLNSGEFRPADIVLLVDAWDTVILGTAEELRAKFIAARAGRSDQLVFCAADRLCAPEYRLAPRFEQLCPTAVGTPWRYPNSGALVGTAEALAALLRVLVQPDADFGEFKEDYDDQLRLQELWMIHAARGVPLSLQLDATCAFFQCMGEPEQGWDFETGGREPRIRNRLTSELPLVAHGCGGHGRWFLADVYRELCLLEYLGLRSVDLAPYKYAGLVPPGVRVGWEHWVDQPPWEFPFQVFSLMRSAELDRTRTHW